MDLTVRDVMTREVPTIPSNATLADAERKLLAGGVGELFVLNEDGFVIGVLPDYVFLRFHLSGAEMPGRIESLMTRRFFVIGPESRLCVAARYLRDHLHPRLAVVEDLRLIGLLTRTNVLRRLCPDGLIPDDAAA